MSGPDHPLIAALAARRYRYDPWFLAVKKPAITAGFTPAQLNRNRRVAGWFPGRYCFACGKWISEIGLCEMSTTKTKWAKFRGCCEHYFDDYNSCDHVSFVF